MADAPVESLKLASLLNDLEAAGVTETASLRFNANSALENARRCQVNSVLTESAVTNRQFDRVYVLLDEKWNQALNAEKLAEVRKVAELVTRVKEAQVEWEGRVRDSVFSNCQCMRKN